MLFFGSGGAFLIGPARNAGTGSCSGIGHRIAALEDSRLLPIVEGQP